MSVYHEGQRELQDRYGGRAVADRLAEHRLHRMFTDADRAIIEAAPFFFLATAWDDTVDCSMKGGLPGFVRVVSPNQIAWADYDGNRMYRSLGNILRNPSVGLLFVTFDGRGIRLRINGRAEIDERPEAVESLPGGERLIVVTATSIFPNCPRYVPTMELIEYSRYAPRPDYTPPEPEWKSHEYIRDVL